MQKLDAHTFHPWEGGEGKVSAQYQICRVELAKQAIVGKEYEKAVRLLSECLDYPHHLGEGKLYGAQENDFYYLLGVAYDALGEKEKAMECWEKATKGPQEPAAYMGGLVGCEEPHPLQIYACPWLLRYGGHGTCAQIPWRSRGPRQQSPRHPAVAYTD